MLYSWLLKPGEMITPVGYKQLMKLNQALKKKRPKYAERHDKLILLHDNTRPCITEPVKKCKQDINWHPPYLSNIVQSDYHLFLSI